MRFRAYKVAKRFDQDISAVMGGFAMRLADGKIASVRIAFGGMAATPKRARQCEETLSGKAWDEAALATGMEALARDFAPISDWRASADYRAKVAANLLRRFFIETTDEQAETRLVGDRRLAHV